MNLCEGNWPAWGMRGQRGSVTDSQCMLLHSESQTDLESDSVIIMSQYTDCD